ncbi:MAG TPA: TIGR03118 family protein [Acetobacteraceae bacterium]|nr:TIGR03118 family protein [Acetobacteraceae bacterium]
MKRHTRNVIMATSLGAGIALSSGRAQAFYQQTDLVSDIPGVAEFTDPNLVNPWGMSSSATSPIWVSDNGTGVATVYRGNGQAVQVGTPPAPFVTIPDGAPTGQVFNPNPSPTNFGGAHFIFASENGAIDAWSGPGTAAVSNKGATTLDVYKGLALGTSSSGNTLYAANFRTGKIDTFNSSFAPVTLSGNFTDPNVPAGYAPFGIQNIGGKLYVTYALQDAAKHDDVRGPGNGFVDVFDLDGNPAGPVPGSPRLIDYVPLTGVLNSPWGLAVAPAGFGNFGGDLLVGNFGDGTINAFDPSTGTFLGTLDDASGNPIVIPGLWGLLFGNGGNGGATDQLFFSAGIPGPGGNVEDNGLFGFLAIPEPSTFALLIPAMALLALRRRRA